MLKYGGTLSLGPNRERGERERARSSSIRRRVISSICEVFMTCERLAKMNMDMATRMSMVIFVVWDRGPPLFLACFILAIVQ